MSSKTVQRARLVLEDAPRDAAQVDRTPFTPSGVGPLLGNILAMIAALAECVIELAEDRDGTYRNCESRNDRGFRCTLASGHEGLHKHPGGDVSYAWREP